MRQRKEKERGEDKKKKKMEDQLEESFLKLSAFRQKSVSHGSSWLFAWREEIIPIFLGQTVNLNCKAAIWLRTFHQTTG